MGDAIEVGDRVRVDTSLGVVVRIERTRVGTIVVWVKLDAAPVANGMPFRLDEVELEYR